MQVLSKIFFIRIDIIEKEEEELMMQFVICTNMSSGIRKRKIAKQMITLDRTNISRRIFASCLLVEKEECKNRFRTYVKAHGLL